MAHITYLTILFVNYTSIKLKKKKPFTIWYDNYARRYLPKGLENLRPDKNVPMNVKLGSNQNVLQ